MLIHFNYPDMAQLFILAASSNYNYFKALQWEMNEK